MKTATPGGRFSAPYLVLPGLYIFAILLTVALSPGTPGGAYYRVMGLCPPVASLGMVVDNDAVIVVSFLLVGTPWWYLVGRIGWDGYQRSQGLLQPIVGAAIAGFTCFISTSMTLDQIKSDIHNNALNSAALTQYSLVALLCTGALFSALLALIAAFTSRES